MLRRPVEIGPIDTQSLDAGRAGSAERQRGDAIPIRACWEIAGNRAGLPFDESTGTIPHTDGRIDGRGNEYVVGWIKRGPTGVIGSNKKDSQHTVDTLVADLAKTSPREFGSDHADELLKWFVSRQPELVTDEHWQLIDRHERSTGEPHGRPRVKLASVAELLRIGRG